MPKSQLLELTACFLQDDLQPISFVKSKNFDYGNQSFPKMWIVFYSLTGNHFNHLADQKLEWLYNELITNGGKTKNCIVHLSSTDWNVDTIPISHHFLQSNDFLHKSNTDLLQKQIIEIEDEEGPLKTIAFINKDKNWYGFFEVGGQTGPPSLSVLQLMFDLLKSYSEFASTDLDAFVFQNKTNAKWPSSPPHLTLYDLCKTIKMARQMGLIVAIYPLEMLLVRSLTKTFVVEKTKLQTRSLVYLTSIGVFESLPLLWNYLETHHNAHQTLLKYQQKNFAVSEISTVARNETPMKRTLEYTLKLLDHHSLMENDQNVFVNENIDHSQYFVGPLLSTSTTTCDGKDACFSVHGRNEKNKCQWCRSVFAKVLFTAFATFYSFSKNTNNPSFFIVNHDMKIQIVKHGKASVALRNTTNSKKEKIIPLTTLYEWMQVMVWNCDAIEYDFSSLFFNKKQFYQHQSSQHPFSLHAGSNRDRKYSLIDLPPNALDHVVGIDKRAVLTFSDFDQMVRNLQLKVVQNVAIPESCFS